MKGAIAVEIDWITVAGTDSDELQVISALGFVAVLVQIASGRLSFAKLPFAMT